MLSRSVRVGIGSRGALSCFVCLQKPLKHSLEAHTDSLRSVSETHRVVMGRTAIVCAMLCCLLANVKSGQ